MLLEYLWLDNHIYKSVCATNTYRTQTTLHYLCILDFTFLLVLQQFTMLPCIVKLSQRVILSLQLKLCLNWTSETAERTLRAMDSALCYTTISQTFLSACDNCLPWIIAYYNANLLHHSTIFHLLLPYQFICGWKTGVLCAFPRKSCSFRHGTISGAGLLVWHEERYKIW